VSSARGRGSGGVAGGLVMRGMTGGEEGGAGGIGQSIIGGITGVKPKHRNCDWVKGEAGGGRKKRIYVRKRCLVASSHSFGV